MSDPADPSPDPYAPPATAGSFDQPPLNRRRVWRAVMIWVGFLVVGSVAAIVMQTTADPDSGRPDSWLAITAMLVGLVNSLGFLSYHVVLIVWLMSGHFRKP